MGAGSALWSTGAELRNCEGRWLVLVCFSEAAHRSALLHTRYVQAGEPTNSALWQVGLPPLNLVGGVVHGICGCSIKRHRLWYLGRFWYTSGRQLPFAVGILQPLFLTIGR